MELAAIGCNHPFLIVKQLNHCSKGTALVTIRPMNKDPKYRQESEG